jgi:hypothetical protein
VASKGQYEIIDGTLDDLNNLPPLHVMLDEPRRSIETGKRNTSIFRVSLEQAIHSDDFESLLDVMRTRNMDCEIPLSDSEVEKAARSAWRRPQPRRARACGCHIAQVARPFDFRKSGRIHSVDRPKAPPLGARLCPQQEHG